MTETSTSVATTYARALAGAAGSDVPAELDALLALQRSIDANPDAWAELCAPTVTEDAQIAAVDGMASGAPKAAVNLLKLLVTRRRLGDLPAIISAFAEIAADLGGDLDVEVTTSVELDEQLRRDLETRLSATTGTKVRLHTSLDPDIIGGLILQYGDTRIDASVRGRIEGLRTQLRQATSDKTDQ